MFSEEDVREMEGCPRFFRLDYLKEQKPPNLMAVIYRFVKKSNVMRIVGHRKEQPITFSASAALLAEGARFNDEIHRLPTGNQTFVTRGIYRFKSFEEANRQDLDCLVKGMAQIAMVRA